MDSGTHLGSVISCCSPSGSSGRHSRLTQCVTGNLPSNECESIDVDRPAPTFFLWYAGDAVISFKTLRLFGVSCFDSSFVFYCYSIFSTSVWCCYTPAFSCCHYKLCLLPFFCGASKSPDVQARAFNLSVSARRCLLRVLPFNVISFSCLWALIAFSFFDNTSATSPSQNLLRHSALKSKHAESLQRRSHFN